MSPRPLSDKELRDTVDLFKQYGSQTSTALATGKSRNAIQHRLYQAVARGLITSDEIIPVSERATDAALRLAAKRNANLGVTPPLADPIELRRLRDQIERLKAERDEALRRALAAEDLRSGMLGLGKPTISQYVPRKDRAKPGLRSAILHLSDLQFAETIALEEMDGVNAYNVEIANRRIAKTFAVAAALLTAHWKGKPPEVLYLCLGGDMVSGGIHAELAKTDGMTRLPSAQAVASQISAGVRAIRKQVGCKVVIFSVPGNHGRLTLKPESKAHVADNLDTLVAWFVEAALKGDKGVEVRYSESIDCLFDVYGYPFLLTHGDRMGSKGGQGFLGSVASILRGHFKLHADYADRGVILYRILTGHFHTTCRLPLGYGNGSLAGWSDYARDLRARKEPASQNMLVVHSEHGIVDFREIQSGDTDEGSIYRARGVA
jgi:hypothetical protein